MNFFPNMQVSVYVTLPSTLFSTTEQVPSASTVSSTTGGVHENHRSSPPRDPAPSAPLSSFDRASGSLLQPLLQQVLQRFARGSSFSTPQPSQDDTGGSSGLRHTTASSESLASNDVIFTEVQYFIPYSGLDSQDASSASPQGLSVEDIAETTLLFSYDNDNDEGHDGPPPVCSICQASFEPRSILRKLNECRHVFHPVCIDRWLQQYETCPVCRVSLRRLEES